METYKAVFVDYLRKELERRGKDTEAAMLARLSVEDQQAYRSLLPLTWISPQLGGRILEAAGAVLFPAAADPICSLNATQLGKLLGRSAKGTNRLLADHGLQFRNDRDEWELTEAGEAWAEAMPYSRNGHSGYQILWNPAVTEQIREAA